MLIDLYRYEEALAAVERALEFEPDNSASVGHRGRVLRNLERFSEARDALELSRVPYPNDEWTLRELGWVDYDEDRYEDALSKFEEFLEMDPDSHWSHYTVGFVLLDLDRKKEAIDAFDQAIALRPDTPSFYNLRGYTRLIENKPFLDVQRAIPDLERAIRLNPKQEYALHHLAIAYAYQGRGDEAVAMLKRGVAVRMLKSKVRRVIRIPWDKKLTGNANETSSLLKKPKT